MAETVEILDSIMGSNKTNGILKWIDSHPNEKYIYISPLLSEVDYGSRLDTDLKNVTFEFPNTDYDNNIKSKSEDLLNLIRSGSNIGATHSLYLAMNKEHLAEMEKQDYILICDEEVNVINSFNHYSGDDLEHLLSNNDISISEQDGMISWSGIDLGKKSKYKYLANLCENKLLYATKRKDNMMVTHLPIKLFTCAKRVIIMTYMFDGNILDCFLKLKGVKIKPFTEIETTKISKSSIRNLLTLLPLDEKLQDIPQAAGKYKTVTTQAQLNEISKYITRVSKRHGAKPCDVLYTFPKLIFEGDKNKKKLKPKGYSFYKEYLYYDDGSAIINSKGKHEYIEHTCWLHANCRATNKYSDKWMLFHCYDRYPNVAVENYLIDYGQKPKRNIYAISEICQWVWRSRIRKGENIILAITNKRMYSVFLKWLNDDDIKE